MLEVALSSVASLRAVASFANQYACEIFRSHKSLGESFSFRIVKNSFRFIFSPPYFSFLLKFFLSFLPCRRHHSERLGSASAVRQTLQQTGSPVSPFVFN